MYSTFTITTSCTLNIAVRCLAQCQCAFKSQLKAGFFPKSVATWLCSSLRVLHRQRSHGFRARYEITGTSRRGFTCRVADVTPEGMAQDFAALVLRDQACSLIHLFTSSRMCLRSEKVKSCLGPKLLDGSYMLMLLRPFWKRSLLSLDILYY